MLVCYKVHLVILSHIKESQNTPSARLQSDIELWRTDLSNADNKLKVAQLTTVSHVAKHLQHQEAFLLPNVSAYLLDSYCLTRYLVTVTSSRLDVLNNSDQSEEDDGMEENNTEDTEDGEWDDYSSDSEQSDTEC